MPKFFAGIGSRETPSEVLEQMKVLAILAGSRNWTLRSGAAPGADSAFEQGCDHVYGRKEIFIPWRGFNHSTSPLFKQHPDSFKVAAEIHPVWNALKPAAKQLVARNMQQIMGQEMNEPVSCVICWTPDGCESIETYCRKTGGTGTAIAFASSLNIPIFNLKNPFRYQYAEEFLLNN